MPTYTNGSEQELVFPTLGLTVAAGESFDTDADITTDGVVIATGKKASKNAAVATAPVDTATEPASDAAVENTSDVSETVADAAAATPSA